MAAVAGRGAAPLTQTCIYMEERAAGAGLFAEGSEAVGLLAGNDDTEELAEDANKGVGLGTLNHGASVGLGNLEG